MSSRFVVFAEGENADYTVDGVGVRYVEISEKEANGIINEASKYLVSRYTVQTYSHDEYGDYETTTDVTDYEICEIKSLSEKIWKRDEGACDLIVVDGKFWGVVFFTGFTDYRGKEEYGFVPIEMLHKRDNLTSYTHVSLSILKTEESGETQFSRKTAEKYEGRVATSDRTSYRIEKKR